MSADPDRGALVDAVRLVLAEVGGLYPAVAEHAPVTRLPGVDEPWLSASESGLQITLVVGEEALPALPRLLIARRRLMDALEVGVELIVADVVAAAPGAADG